MTGDAAMTSIDSAPLLSVASLAAGHGGRLVFEAVSFNLARGEIAALLGPSGTGKTTLLRSIAGLHAPTSGTIRLRGADASRLKPEQRGVGFVFQDLALFPHLDVAGNIAFGLARWPRAQREARVADLLQRTGLAAFGARKPHELSGGQQQRVALARSLAPKPDLLLLDEPLSSLDADLRPKLRDELRALLKSEGTAALLVTHDQDEAFAFADTVGVMLDGRLAQWSPGYDLYHRPADAAVARFVGDGRLLPVRRLDDGRVASPFGPLAANGAATSAEGLLLLRPDDVVLGEGDTDAVIIDLTFHGAETLHRLRLDDGTELSALAPSHRRFAVGERVRVRPDLAHVVVFPR
ncbi:MAG TPA: ABC transporter ATP-binding protein [Xanthomonadaceae bacterium]|jgi:iron(III) transport system ATP-binding protein|nr:ABC transporter ATP-binding protein [Xanthomonadaceae bacterium]